MFFSAIIAGFFAGFSPFWGLLIIIAYGFRHYQKNSAAYFGTFAVAAITSVFLFTVGSHSLALMDAFLGIGFTVWLFFYYLSNSQNLQKAFLIASGNGFLYGFLRQYLFRQVINDQIIASSSQSLGLMRELFSNNPEMQSLLEQSAQTSLSFFQKYGTSIWFVVIFFALYLGSLWLAGRNKISWKQDAFFLPYWSVYLLITAMLFFLFPLTRITGSNLLMIILPYFLIQGIAVFFYFWKYYTSNKKFILFFLISCLLLNYVFFLFLIFLGIADLWLLFRQKHQEKIKPL